MSSLKCFILHKAYYLCEKLYPERFESCQPYFNRYYEECANPNSNQDETLLTGACRPTAAANHFSDSRTTAPTDIPQHRCTTGTTSSNASIKTNITTKKESSTNIFENNIYL